MKKLFAVVGLALSFNAAADMSDINAIMTECKGVGDLAAIVLNVKQSGSDWTPEQMKAKIHEASNQRFDEDHWILHRKLDEANDYAIDYGYNQATDKKDAYMSAWSKCMDVMGIYR